MRTGEAAKLMDVTNNTIRAWIDHEALAKYFSNAARGEHGSAHRRLNNDDLITLNTIRVLRNVRKIEDWREIADYLETGQREREFIMMAADADMRTIPVPQAEQSARAAATLAERDAALARVDELHAQIEQMKLEHKAETDKIRSDHKAETNAYVTEIRKLEREIGKLQAMLDMKSG